MTVDHRDRVERAVRFIGENLHRPLALEEVARVARLSEFHFHRIFSAVMGETVGRFVTRRRLEVAALKLAYEPRRSITDIAFSSGYSSPSNFAKAFTGYFGCSPSDVRHPDPDLPPAVGRLTRLYGKDFHPCDLHVMPIEMDKPERRAQYAELNALARFEHCRGIDLACLASPQGYDMDALIATWQELIERARHLSNDAGVPERYGIAHDSPLITAPNLCRYHACVPCPSEADLVQPLFKARLPEGQYAVFSYDGEIAEVETFYRRIYSVWFPESGVLLDDFTAVHRYEITGAGDGRTAFDSWLKIRAYD